MTKLSFSKNSKQTVWWLPILIKSSDLRDIKGIKMKKDRNALPNTQMKKDSQLCKPILVLDICLPRY